MRAGLRRAIEGNGSGRSNRPVRRALGWATRLRLREAAAAIALVLGLLTIPVNCALAEGPHSLFVQVAVPGATAVVHHHGHQHAGGACVGAAQEPGGVPTADELPAAGAAASALAAIAVDGATAAERVADTVTPVDETAPAALAPRLDVPPPRS